MKKFAIIYSGCLFPRFNDVYIAHFTVLLITSIGRQYTVLHGFIVKNIHLTLAEHTKVLNVTSMLGYIEINQILIILST